MATKPVRDVPIPDCLSSELITKDAGFLIRTIRMEPTNPSSDGPHGSTGHSAWRGNWILRDYRFEQFWWDAD